MPTGSNFRGEAGPKLALLTRASAALAMKLPNESLRLSRVPLTLYLFLGVFALRLFVLARLTASEFLLPSGGDMQFYNDWALRILRGQWTDHFAFYGLPRIWETSITQIFPALSEAISMSIN